MSVVRLPISAIPTAELALMVETGAAKVVTDPGKEKEREALRRKAVVAAGQAKDDMEEASRDERLRGEAEARRRARPGDEKKR